MLPPPPLKDAVMTLKMIAADQAAALLCRLAAARLEMDEVKIRALLRRLDRYTRPLDAAEQIARAAIDAERAE